ncbi:TonB-dependent receptor P26 [Dyadobacter sp. CECT 9275]|uniref:TonB-dependent receptor P26 n=1 Tax=Dyadobacter helix TaxID=2822344 RepID=A0A916JDI0_9BACT|nr:SusC/RagA family TonB-linked outer membrane protein [Dyadobacter sp. CECT 9275]CAG5002524.1 TonB-dependent receptor P26 [Dyadobacter sp. CECT 9275]
MKITFVQIVLAFLFVGVSWATDVSAQELLNRTISIHVQNENIKTVLHMIEKNADVRFSYSPQVVPPKRTVSLKADNVTVGEVLDNLLSPLQVGYIVSGRQIILSRKTNSTEKKEAREEKTEEVIPLKANVKSVSGKVTDDTGSALPGVTILVKNSQTGTISDADGDFRLDVPEGSNILVFSFVGYLTQEIEIGKSNYLKVSMVVDARTFDEVVVTAFGIKKEQKSLTYATQQISGKSISAAGNPNVLGGLQGKVAGVTVNLNSGMPGKSPGIRIRGSRSLSGNNSPLYVVDGLPISGGDRVLDLNPNDIESMNVLKGPAASALYGLRASNGVVVITTKNGAGAKGKPTVSFDTQFSVDQIGMLPDLQMEFAQGENGVFNPNSIFTWGPRISSMTTYTNQLGEQEEPGVYDNDKDFFRNGSTMNTNLSFSNSGDFGNFMIAVGRNDQKGIVPNSSMSRNNIKFNGDFKLLKNLTSSISVNYSDLKVDDFPEKGGNENIFRGITETPPSYNLKGKPYATPGDPYQQIFYRVSQNNPYWVINHTFRNEKTKRTLGNILLNYKFTPDLALNYRVGVDHYTTVINDYNELGYATRGRTNPPSGGDLFLYTRFSNQLNSNLFLNYSKRIGKVWNVDAIIGNEVFDSNFQSINTTGSNLVVGNWPNLANATLISASNSTSKQRIVGFYGNVNIGWNDKIYINASGRNDIVSNMPAGNRSFFYPSIGASAIVTELLPESKQIFSFAKLRATLAEVGQAGPIYVNGRGFTTNTPGSFVFPYQGLVSWTQSSTRINPNLRPENTRTFEIGGDLRFLSDRISIDYTYFDSKSDGQIFNVPVAITTGASSEIRNGGKIRNNGHEIVLSLVPVQIKDFRWEFNTNFTTYKSKVLELYGGTQRVNISSGVISLVAEVGNVYPQFVGTSYMRDPASNQIIYQSDQSKVDYGLPIINNTQKVLGTPTPDFEMNFINSFTFKGLTLSAQLDWRKGGLIYNHSLNESQRRGLAGETRDRETSFVPVGKKGTVANGTVEIVGDNDIVIKKDVNYFNNLWPNSEASLSDASFVRLREVGLSYNFPAKWLKGRKISDASVYFTGRNLFLITKAFTDPEVNITEGSYSSPNSQGIEVSQIPQTKSYGAGIRLKF